MSKLIVAAEGGSTPDASHLNDFQNRVTPTLTALDVLRGRTAELEEERQADLLRMALEAVKRFESTQADRATGPLQ